VQHHQHVLDALMLAVISPISATELHRLRKMCEANSAIPNFYSRNRADIGYRAALAKRWASREYICQNAV
jgi:hypothetical protein